jgi:hypothetical protein
MDIRSAAARMMALPAVLLFSATLAQAQGTGAALQGAVTDEQGGLLPGASVTITNTDTGLSREVVSDGNGRYRAVALPPGPYEIRVIMSGFVNFVRTGLVLTLGQEATVNLGLRIATLTETVTVTAAAPLVEITSNTLERNISRAELDTLPLAGRNFANLATMAPGVAGVGSGTGAGAVVAGGQTSRSNSFLIDGASNDDTVVATQRGGFSLEAVREFAVMTNQFSAEYGMASGAIVSVVTRSGTNTVQGRGFAFHRDDTFDAQNPFSKAQGSGKAPFSQQRFGGFLGGPIVHDKFHYFGAYEGLREASTKVITSSLVPPDQREEPASEKGHQYFVKSDLQMNAQNTLSLRYRADKRRTTGNGIDGLNTRERGNNTSTLDQDVVANYTSVLTPVLLNEVRVQASRRSTFSDTEGYSVDGMPEINRPSGRFGKAQNMPQGRDENRYQIVENLTYTAGTHDFKFGADFSFIRADSFFPRNRDGNFTFATDLPFDPNNLATYPTQYVVAIANPAVDLPNDLYSFFAQDQWRLRTNLTFNLGVRYDRERGFAKIVGTPDDANNFQPRLGFVWDPKNDGRTAIRGGYGHYVDQSFLNIQLNVAAAKNSTELVIANPGFPDPFSRGSTTNNPPSLTTLVPKPKTPENRTASLGIKREVITGLAVSVDGVYSRGYNQYAWFDENYPNSAGVRPNPAFGRITQYADYGHSWYKALLVSVEGRNTRGPGWSVSYTRSKTERDVEGFQFTPQDMNNLFGDRGLADNHRAHQVVANVTWALPGGFQVGAVAQARSGLPFNITTGVDNNRDTFTTVDRPDLVNPDGDRNDPATYDANFTGRVGNTPRNYGEGPAFFNMDARVSKFIRFGAKKVEIFAESFNVLNRVNFARRQGNLRSPSTFGRSTTIEGNMRQVEIGFRFDF